MSSQSNNNSVCHKTSNNKHFSCPPRMDDGRHFTDYRPNCHTNNLLRSNNQVHNSFQYRMYLTHNADKLMDLNRSYACQKNCCGPCQKPYDVGTMLPEETVVTCNERECKVSSRNPNGLGQGRVYSNQPLHCPNLPKSLPVNQGINGCAPPADNFNYYPVNPKETQKNRLTVPGGGEPLSGGDPKYYQ